MQKFTLFLCFWMACIIFLFVGCELPLTMSQFYSEEDEVKQTRRVYRNFTYNIPMERDAPLRYVEQKLFKEILPDSSHQIHCYETISTSIKSYDLKPKVYFIMNNYIDSVDMEVMGDENFTRVTEEMSLVENSDSSYTNVVTGYSQNSSRLYRIRYPLSPTLIEKMKDAREIRFRYYAGPAMMTTRLHGVHLVKFKDVLNYR